jgi:putative ABC transport system permease protein
MSHLKSGILLESVRDQSDHMLKNNILVSLRSLWKSKGFTAINILGLTVGLATCLMILLFVMDELGYDRFNKKADRIYRIDADIQFGGNRMILAVTPDPMGPTLKKDYPQVEQYVRFRNFPGKFLVKKGNQNFQENRVQFADSTLFAVFNLPLIHGNPETALVDPGSVVLNETMANKYFNSLDVVGKSIVINDTNNFKVTGVMKDMPSQSHFVSDFFISMSTNAESRENMWVFNNFNTYLLLKPGADPKQVTVRFSDMLDKYLFPQIQQMLGSSKDAFKKGGNFANYSLMPLRDIHLRSNKTGEMGINSDIEYIYIFSGIAILILLIAGVNFMNLSTARSANRAKEVGVRKVLGSLRSNLIAQFLAESILVSLIALILAVALVSVGLPYFNHLSGKNINMDFFSRPGLQISLLGLAIFIGILAGIYPAFYLSSFAPIKVLKGVLSTGFKTGRLRSTLVVFQFSISIFLMISTVTIYNQLKFIRSKDLGFNREQVIVLQNTDVLGSQTKAFRAECMRIRGVENITMTGFLPTNGIRNEAPMFLDPTLDQKRAISMQIWNVDEHYIPTLGISVSRGRNFSEDYKTDYDGVIINESTARLMGYKNPLDKNLYIPKDFHAAQSAENTLKFHVVGVIKDFNFNSLREPVSPLVFLLGPAPNNIAIRVHTADLPGLMAKLNKVWLSMAPAQPFESSFMDDDFNHIYDAEQRIGSIFINFAVLAIFIACLGLFGLVTFAAEQRSREIGIRKVLGASVNNIVGLLSRDFMRLVIIAALIAFPVAGWAMHRWLQDFAYRVNIGWWVFLVAGLLALIIALVTVSVQAIRAALVNPVESLKAE